MNSQNNGSVPPTASNTDAQEVMVPSLMLEHKVQGVSILPGVFFLAAMAEFLKDGLSKNILVENIKYLEPALLDENSTTSLTFSRTELTAKGAHVNVSEGNIIYCTYRYSVNETAITADYELLEQIKQNSSDNKTPNSFYEHLVKLGNQYGKPFQTIQTLSVSPGVSAYSQIRLAENQFNIDSGITSYKIANQSTLLDGCIQTIAAAANRDRAYVLSSIDSIEISSIPDDICSAYVNIKEKTDENVVIADVIVTSADSKPCLVLYNVELNYPQDSSNKKTLPKAEIAVAATYTAEPIETSLKFWSEYFDNPSTVTFAPYNQIFQQLLDPSSELCSNTTGFNAILIRPEDWINEQSIPLQVSESTKEAHLQQHERIYIEPNVEIAHLNQYETEYVYKEIFEDLAYLKHDIQINDGDVIIDIGANIGLFTLFVNKQARDTTIFSFEPSPPVFDILKTNTKLYGSNVIPVNKGVSDKTKSAEFTFYNKSSVFSSFSADGEDDAHAIRAVIENMVKGNSNVDSEQLETLVEELIEDRLSSTNYTCELVSLSDVITEHNIQTIDLLKLDAEKSELDVLNGIKPEHWKIIKQIVLEVHDREGALIAAVVKILEENNFDLQIEEEEFLQNSGLYNIFAKRSDVTIETETTHPRAISKIKQTYQLHATFDEFLTSLQSYSDNCSVPSIVAITPASDSTVKDVELIRVLKEFDQTATERISVMKNVSILTSTEIEKSYPVDNYNDTVADELGKIPYTSQYFSALGTALTRNNLSMRRNPYKVIVLDCDNTLWGGVCGEIGADQVEISSNYLALQNFVLSQSNKGMLLCLCSKNSEQDVWSVFDTRSDMRLTRSNIVAHRINWTSKSENIVSLADELNLGLESFIFLDDNPVECAEVMSALTPVLTLQIPSDENLIPNFLNNVWAFDNQNTTSEDQKRTQMYKQNVERENDRKSSSSLSDFLSTLDLNVQHTQGDIASIERVSQLTYRTNQFNVSTKRRSEAELVREMKDDALQCMTTRVRDRFGDYGLVGVVLYRLVDKSLEVDTFLLSCRVLGRGVEHNIVAALGNLAIENNLDTVKIPLISTDKNQPAYDFLINIADDHHEKTDDGFIFTLSATEASTTVYQPDIDTGYANRAMNRSVKSNTRTQLSSTNSKPEIFFEIASKFQSAEDINEEVIKHSQIQEESKKTAAHIKPKNELQALLADAWQSILNVEHVSIDENFFEVGGSSLKGVQLIAKLKNEHGINFAIVDLFAAPTISAQQKLLEDRKTGNTEESMESQSRGSKRRNNLRNRRSR